MRPARHRAAGVAILCATLVSSAPAEVTAERARRALELGVRALKSRQLTDGTWAELNGQRYGGGVTCLMTLALLQAGEPVASPTMQAALSHVQRQADEHVYVVALKIMALAKADPIKYRRQIESAARLARFVTLNPHTYRFPRHLDELLGQTDSNDPLRDNILLAQTKLIADQQRRAEKLAQLHKEFRDADGGMQALYELALLKIGFYQGESNSEQKKKYLAEAREILTSFISLYPNSFCADQVQKNLDDLPAVD